MTPNEGRGTFRIRDHGHVNGRIIRSYFDHVQGRRKYVVSGVEGEYLTQEAAENAARTGDQMTHYLTRPNAIGDRENFPRQEDCPNCGLPTLVADRFASYEPPVRLDPMPVAVFTRNARWPHGATVIEAQHPDHLPGEHQWHYVEHRCPMPVATFTREVRE